MIYPPLAVFSPALAAGAALAAVGVPLVVHLLFRKRYQIIPWAAMRFLMVAERRHKRRIDQWLLLVLRTLTLVLLLLAMAATTAWAERLWQAVRPGTPETTADVPRTHHVLVIDASLSMTAKVDKGADQTRFDRALALADKLVQGGNRGDGYTVIVAASSPRSHIPGPSNDRDKVLAELRNARNVRAEHSTADHAAALVEVESVLKRSPRAYPRRQVTFFTDLQRASWTSAAPRPENPAAEVWQRIATRSDVVVVDVARDDRDNLAVAEVALADPMPLVDQPATVTVTVANLGRVERKDVRVELLMGRPSGGGDALVSVEQKPLDILPVGGRTAVKFELNGPHAFRDPGVHVVQAKLVEGDDLATDDTRALAVEVRDGIHVRLIEGKADPDPERRAATFLARALYPPNAKPSATPLRPKTLSPAEFLDPNVGDLSGVDCVFVCDVFNPTPDLAAKLDAVLRRGGTVVVGLGPNAAASRAQYNAVLYRDGSGVLPGALAEPVAKPNPDAPGFRLYADEDEYRKPPLLPFGNDRARAALTSVPFHSYVKLDIPEGRARRILNFARPQAAPDPKGVAKPDAALVEWPRHRGRVYVFTSSLNDDWNDWPKPPNYLMFWHEFVKYSVANPDRHTLRVGEPVEEFFPASAAGLTAGLNTPDGRAAAIPLVLQDESGVMRFTDTAVSGLYRAGINGSRDRVFAVNPPEVVAGAPTESDLKRIDRDDFKAVKSLQFVEDPDEVKPTDESGATVTTQPRPWGPHVARIAVTAALIILALELLLAWRFGPSQAGGTSRPAGGSFVVRAAVTMTCLLPLAVAAFLLFAVAHEQRTGNPLGFLPHDLRSAIETAAGVPAAAPGEGTKWRLEAFTAYLRNPTSDRRLILALAGVAVAFVGGVYWLERRAAGGARRVIVPALLRCAVFLLALYVVLAQIRLAFDREGYPEVVILLDTSASMAHRDDFKDDAVRAKAEELAGSTGLSESNRLKLAQALLTRKDADWLDRLLNEKKVKVHLYAVDTQKRVLTAIDDETQLADGRAAIQGLKADGAESKLGSEGIEAVLKDFRGSPLAAIVMFTDGVTTSGTELPKAAQAASREGVPLFMVGVGDTWETPDLGLMDFRADEVVGRGDRVLFEVRLKATGQVPGGPTTVFLREKMPDGKLEDRGQVSVTPDPSGNPVPIAIPHAPEQVGEKTFVLEVPGVQGEANLRNNKLERTITVTESRKIRVLYVEGYPRYDFRFVKVMLERESDKSVGGKSVEVQIVLLDATKGWPETDRSAFRGEFPTRTELFGFDVVILGDVDPKLIGGTRSATVLRDLADFVKEKGGGMLFLSGEHGTPAAFADTPLADILPVIPSEGQAAKRPPEEQPITDEFRPKLTNAGTMHPLFRFATDDAESARIWGNLRPLYWYAKGYRRKPLTSVLATHPTRAAEGGAPGELHPLVLQQFAGAGPVLFLGFDDTWRWRFRSDEEHFDRFWLQAVRVLSRSRVRRPEVRVEPKTEFRRGEKVTVQVRFPIEAPPPGDARVRVQMTRTPLPNRDGTPGAGPTETNTLVLDRVPNQAGQFETTLPRAADGEYRFELTDPDLPGTRPGASARVLPPLSERDRVELNKSDLQAAAAQTGGGFYTLATANDVFHDLKNLQRVPLNQPCPPVPVWNSPLLYLLILLLLGGEWLLRKRERLL